MVKQIALEVSDEKPHKDDMIRWKNARDQTRQGFIVNVTETSFQVQTSDGNQSFVSRANETIKKLLLPLCEGCGTRPNRKGCLCSTPDESESNGKLSSGKLRRVGGPRKVPAV